MPVFSLMLITASAAAEDIVRQIAAQMEPDPDYPAVTTVFPDPDTAWTAYSSGERPDLILLHENDDSRARDFITQIRTLDAPPPVLLLTANRGLEQDWPWPQDVFPLPLRAGFLCERLERHRLRSRAGAPAPDRIALGPFILLYYDSSALRRGGTPGPAIPLTDKERDLLYMLWRAPGHRLDRRALLDRVWGYAEGVETHTLETHIYRLRQKIEADPGTPTFLLTDGDGYRLAP